MATFIIQHNKKKKRNVLILSVSLIFFPIALFSIDLFFYDKVGEWIYNVLVSFSLLWQGVTRFRKRKRDFFIQIDDEKIEWLLREIEEKETKINWNKVSWIKLERDNTVTIYPGAGFKLMKFSEADREKILTQIQEVANARQIRVINFLVMEQAVA